MKNFIVHTKMMETGLYKDWDRIKNELWTNSLKYSQQHWETQWINEGKIQQSYIPYDQISEYEYEDDYEWENDDQEGSFNGWLNPMYVILFKSYFFFLLNIYF